MGSDERPMSCDEPSISSDEPSMSSDEPSMSGDEPSMSGEEPSMSREERLPPAPGVRTDPSGGPAVRGNSGGCIGECVARGSGGSGGFEGVGSDGG